MTLRKALGDAARWGVVPRNVATLADPPTPRRAELNTWTAGQLRAFLAHVEGERLEAIWHLAAGTGMRRGEVLGLRWLDVDLDRGRVAVRRTLVMAGGRVVVSEPKTARGRRAIALDPRTVAALRAWRKAQAAERLAWGGAWQDRDGLVFTREDGAPLHPEWLSDAFDWRVKQAGLPRIRFHDLRHTHASLGLAAACRSRSCLSGSAIPPRRSPPTPTSTSRRRSRSRRRPPSPAWCTATPRWGGAPSG